MEQFIRENGYLTVFVTVAVSGEFGLIAGVALARTGSVTLPGVIILGAVASFIGNMFYYFAGKFLWNRWHFLKDRFGGRVERSSHFVRRFGSPLMLISRFFYGVRNIVPIILGLYDVNGGVFVAYNIIGAFIWAWFFTEAGGLVASYILGPISHLQRTILWGIAVVVAAGASYVLIRRFVSHLER